MGMSLENEYTTKKQWSHIRTDTEVKSEWVTVRVNLIIMHDDCWQLRHIKKLSVDLKVSLKANKISWAFIAIVRLVFCVGVIKAQFSWVGGGGSSLLFVVSTCMQVEAAESNFFKVQYFITWIHDFIWNKTYIHVSYKTQHINVAVQRRSGIRITQLLAWLSMKQTAKDYYFWCSEKYSNTAAYS